MHAALRRERGLWATPGGSLEPRRDSPARPSFANCAPNSAVRQSTQTRTWPPAPEDHQGRGAGHSGQARAGTTWPGCGRNGTGSPADRPDNKSGAGGPWRNSPRHQPDGLNGHETTSAVRGILASGRQDTGASHAELTSRPKLPGAAAGEEGPDEVTRRGGGARKSSLVRLAEAQGTAGPRTADQEKSSDGRPGRVGCARAKGAAQQG